MLSMIPDHPIDTLGGFGQHVLSYLLRNSVIIILKQNPIRLRRRSTDVSLASPCVTKCPRTWDIRCTGCATEFLRFAPEAHIVEPSTMTTSSNPARTQSGSRRTR